jgi:hypothetical protein
MRLVKWCQFARFLSTVYGGLDLLEFRDDEERWRMDGNAKDCSTLQSGSSTISTWQQRQGWIALLRR